MSNFIEHSGAIINLDLAFIISKSEGKERFTETSEAKIMYYIDFCGPTNDSRRFRFNTSQERDEYLEWIESAVSARTKPKQ